MSSQKPGSGGVKEQAREAEGKAGSPAGWFGAEAPRMPEKIFKTLKVCLRKINNFSKFRQN